MQIKITIRGQLGKQWTEWFENLEISYDGENTIISGNVADQAALHGMLNRIRDLNLTLISVISNTQKD